MDNLDSFKDIKDFAFKISKRYTKHNLGVMSAYMAYYWILSFFPLLIFIISILTFTNLPTGIFMEYIEKIVPTSIADTVNTTIANFVAARSTAILSFGGLLTLWSAGMAVNALIRGIHTAYGSNYVRPYIIARLVAIFYTILLALLIIVLMVVLVFGNRIADYVFGLLGVNKGIVMPIWNIIRLIAPFVVLVCIIYALYRFIPRKYLTTTNVWPGVIFASTSWYIFTVGFSIYVDNFAKYNQLYGSLGGVFVLLIWLYFSGTMLLLGAEINALIQEMYEEKTKRTLSDY